MVLGGFRSFHVLVTTNKSKFDGYSVRKRVLMISRITFGIVMSACKESRVRQPGASGFCFRASEFCS